MSSQGCDAVVSAKLSRTSRPIRHVQGKKTAANARVPFIVVGRHMTADNLRRSLLPLLEPGKSLEAGAGAGVGEQGVSRAAAAEAVRAARVTGSYFPATQPSHGQAAHMG